MKPTPQNKTPNNRTRYKNEWRIKNHPERVRIYSLVSQYPERYPLDDKCIFCEANENLEHAHLDYEDNGENYVTACHQCNQWMRKYQKEVNPSYNFRLEFDLERMSQLYGMFTPQ